MQNLAIHKHILAAVAALAGLWLTAAPAAAYAESESEEPQAEEKAADDRAVQDCACPSPAAAESEAEADAEYIYVGPRQNVRKRIVRDRD